MLVSNPCIVPNSVALTTLTFTLNIRPQGRHFIPVRVVVDSRNTGHDTGIPVHSSAQAHSHLGASYHNQFTYQHVLGRLEETRESGGNPCGHEETV